ncbi:Asp-tRNA(Asn)/Glu-tRNA(Gln) amidotransferase subunit GatA [Legionella londiniensis]|uniref:Glutamyl-tRNA(Gln) amidotransferase subunit A n=1 Tax=Legionella londiniensis TaxID=45068 RepID=A0A0W0VNT5_9GAMM|nr:Asp-tRNA(Asn)/Glu-tRNA(Gln) amidotransferase subunit GatA [Legionella londiniensis]KTD21751.1 aspartyl/glutamyl-tRNA amidotransferase subunit A [Legionella londiniensis]STX93412.1 aspartyl/glutamyl-tRNA amidotransferase subunit A [Legionella londiniensis]
MQFESIRSLHKALYQKKISSIELANDYLNRINQAKTLNAFISIDEEGALSKARAADRLIQQGKMSFLTGIPFAHKDIFCTETMPTTCGSRMLANFQAPYSATIAAKLGMENAVLLGKTNMDEFAMGSSNENSYFGPVKNPWNHAHVPGGSSGGSAAAVAANLIPFATGSDTGGSIRQPAAFCGISGMKPTYGLVSRFGMVAFASSLDQAGPMARSAEDLAIVLQAMAGFDPRDSTSINKPVPDYLSALGSRISPLRIGLPKSFFQPEVEAGIQKAILEALKIYTEAGAEIMELDLKFQPLWVPCYYVIACAEASSNLARFDGIRFGYRTPDAENLFDLINRSREEGFGLEVKRRILTGTHVLSSGYFDAYYVQAQKIRRLIQQEFLEVFKQVDVIIGPTTPTLAFKLGEKTSDPTTRYLADIFTVAANLAGLPAISIPAGLSKRLPIGMQLLGPYFSESRLLNLAHFFQQHTSWHQIEPEEKI